MPKAFCLISLTQTPGGKVMKDYLENLRNELRVLIIKSHYTEVMLAMGNLGKVRTITCATHKALKAIDPNGWRPAMKPDFPHTFYEEWGEQFASRMNNAMCSFVENYTKRYITEKSISGKDKKLIEKLQARFLKSFHEISGTYQALLKKETGN